ncbi:MAG: HGGxSTG domain-containing protein [Gammaproteobacteria bacterium]
MRKNVTCRAKTRKNTPCRCKTLANGRCRLHGGLSTGPRTQA